VLWFSDGQWFLSSYDTMWRLSTGAGELCIIGQGRSLIRLLTTCLLPACCFGQISPISPLFFPPLITSREWVGYLVHMGRQGGYYTTTHWNWKGDEPDRLSRCFCLWGRDVCYRKGKYFGGELGTVCCLRFVFVCQDWRAMAIKNTAIS